MVRGTGWLLNSETPLSRHLPDRFNEELQTYDHVRTSQFNRLLIVRSRLAPAGDHSSTDEICLTKLAKRVGFGLQRGLPDPCQRQRVVDVDTTTRQIYLAQLPLTTRVTPVCTDSVRFLGTFVVCRHSVGPVIYTAQ